MLDSWPFGSARAPASIPKDVAEARVATARRLARVTAVSLLAGVIPYEIVLALGLVDGAPRGVAGVLGAIVIIALSTAVAADLTARLPARAAGLVHQAFPVLIAAVVVLVGIATTVTPVYLVAGAALLALAGAVGEGPLGATTPIVFVLPILGVARDGLDGALALGALAIYVIVALTQRASTVTLLAALHEEVGERDRARRLAWQLETVARGARAVTALHVDDVMQAVADTATASDWQVAALYLVDPEHDGRLRLAGHSHLPREMVGIDLALGQGLAGRAVANGATVRTDDYSTWPGRLDTPGAEQLRAAVATPVRTERGVVGAIAVGRTDELKIDDGSLIALELLSAQAGRALELASRDQQQLRTIDELRRVEERQGDFLSAVSHEVRTPVTVVLGATETLDERWEYLSDPQRRSLVRQAHLNAHALGRLVTALLDGARLREGRLRPAPADVPLAPLVRRLVERLQPVVGSAVSTEVDPDLGVHADPDLLARVLENLLTNAAKYAGEDATITVGARPVGDEVVVSVTDDGPGLSPEVVEHLGERFFRGDHRGGKIPGVGLGISFVQQVLASHGQVLSVTSTPDVATTFSFRLPRAARVPER